MTAHDAEMESRKLTVNVSAELTVRQASLLIRISSGGRPHTVVPESPEEADAIELALLDLLLRDRQGRFVSTSLGRQASGLLLEEADRAVEREGQFGALGWSPDLTRLDQLADDDDQASDGGPTTPA